MSVIPLTIHGSSPTVVSTREQFDASGGLSGAALLICDIDDSQLRTDGGDSNLSYDLRIGREYKDHREAQKEELLPDGTIKLLPGVAVIIETEETVCLPRSMFGYIVPKVKLLQKGVSNTVSKIDAGYNGPLVVTLFNLGKRTVVFRRRDRFCSLVVHHVMDGALLYSKAAQRITGDGKKRRWQALRDWVEANSGMLSALAVLATIVLLFEQIVVALWK